MNRLKMAAVTAAALPMLAAGPLSSLTPPAAAATTGTMVGLFGLAPNFNSITVSDSSVCPCSNVPYSFWPGQPGIADGVAAVDKWISTTSGRKTLLAFSKGTHSALGWIRDNPYDFDAYTVKFVLLGSPETPGNTYPYEGHKGGHGLPETGNYDNVTFVVRQYDGYADAPYDKFNLLALMNASVTTHLNGYNNLDLDNPDAVYVDPKTGAKTLYFRSDVLPILAPIDWLTSDEQMAKLDALLRPLIEAAYRRPVEIPAKPTASAVNARMASLTADVPAGESDDDTAPSGPSQDGVEAEAENPTVEPALEPAVQTPELQTTVVDEVSESVDPPLSVEVDPDESAELTLEDDAETVADADEDDSTGPEGTASGDTPATAPSEPTTASGSGGDSAQTTSGGRHRAPLKGTKSRHSAADAGSSESSAPSSADSTAD